MMERNRPTKTEWLTGTVLLAAMWGTRVRWLEGDDHFGQGLALPDASWAVFFLAGLLTRSLWWPALLLVSSVVLDYIALRQGVPAYCVTPAYVFLIPSYLALWGAARWAIRQDGGFGFRQIARISFALCAGVVAAFVISNASFYALSGYFTDMPASVYVERVARFLPGYFSTTALYCAFAALCIYVWHGWRTVLTQRLPDEP